MGGPRRPGIVAVITVAIFAIIATHAALRPPRRLQHNDFGGFRNIVPPAQGADANLAQIGAFQANGSIPHTPATVDGVDVRGPGLQASQIPNFYKDASFGAKPANVDAAARAAT